jgi:hypothetical protein
LWLDPELVVQVDVALWRSPVLLPRSDDHTDAEDQEDKATSSDGSEGEINPAALLHHVPALSQRQYDILQALLELHATSADKRRPTMDIAKRAEGIEADPEGYKQPIAELATLGFVSTKEGRGGGCWLTAKGRAVAEQLNG